MEKIVEVEGLKKSYGAVQAVKGISFDVESGSLFAFLGINGAGKSTTINMLCTLLEPDYGKVSICGYDLMQEAAKIRSKIGVIFQGSVMDKRLSVKDNLTSRASFYGLFGRQWKDRLNELDEILELGDIMSRPYGKLSGGQRRRVDLARGLINTPKLLFLDEPTTGLDPQTRKKVWQVVDDLRKNTGMTVFLTTHYMEEADGADDVVIIDEGRIVASGAPNMLKNRFSADCVKVYSPRSAELDKLLVDGGTYENECYRFMAKDSEEAKRFIVEHADIIPDFEVIKGNMDDVFLNVTGKKLGSNLSV